MSPSFPLARRLHPSLSPISPSPPICPLVSFFGPCEIAASTTTRTGGDDDDDNDIYLSPRTTPPLLRPRLLVSSPSAALVSPLCTHLHSSSPLMSPSFAF